MQNISASWALHSSYHYYLPRLIANHLSRPPKLSIYSCSLSTSLIALSLPFRCCLHITALTLHGLVQSIVLAHIAPLLIFHVHTQLLSSSCLFSSSSSLSRATSLYSEVSIEREQTICHIFIQSHDSLRQDWLNVEQKSARVEDENELG